VSVKHPLVGVEQYDLSLADGADTHPPTNKRTYFGQANLRNTASLPSRHLPRRSNWQLQDLTQGAQIRISWPNAVIFPKVNAGLTDADLFSHFSDRQTTLDPSIT
jgi:hypothetical protein